MIYVEGKASIVLLIFVSFISQQADAAVYQCKDVLGNISFSDKPCTSDSKDSKVLVADPKQDVVNPAPINPASSGSQKQPPPAVSWKTNIEAPISLGSLNFSKVSDGFLLIRRDGLGPISLDDLKIRALRGENFEVKKQFTKQEYSNFELTVTVWNEEKDESSASISYWASVYETKPDVSGAAWFDLRSEVVNAGAQKIGLPDRSKRLNDIYGVKWTWQHNGFDCEMTSHPYGMVDALFSYSCNMRISK